MTYTINTLLFYYMPYFNILITILITLCQLSIIYVNKPINSLLFLIVLLLHFGIQLLLFNYEFFFVLLIIVYLGGIAILFLSAVMTLTIFKSKKLNNTFNFSSILEYSLIAENQTLIRFNNNNNNIIFKNNNFNNFLFFLNFNLLTYLFLYVNLNLNLYFIFLFFNLYFFYFQKVLFD